MDARRRAAVGAVVRTSARSCERRSVCRPRAGTLAWRRSSLETRCPDRRRFARRSDAAARAARRGRGDPAAVRRRGGAEHGPRGRLLRDHRGLADLRGLTGAAPTLSGCRVHRASPRRLRATHLRNGRAHRLAARHLRSRSRNRRDGRLPARGAGARRWTPRPLASLFLASRRLDPRRGRDRCGTVPVTAPPRNGPLVALVVRPPRAGRDIERVHPVRGTRTIQPCTCRAYRPLHDHEPRDGCGRPLLHRRR